RPPRLEHRHILGRSGVTHASVRRLFGAADPRVRTRLHERAKGRSRGGGGRAPGGGRVGRRGRARGGGGGVPLRPRRGERGPRAGSTRPWDWSTAASYHLQSVTNHWEIVVGSE